MKKTIFFALLTFIFFSGCIQKEISFSVPIFKENEMKTDISVNLGQTLNFAMESNPTTGYQWFVKYDNKMLQLVQEKFSEKGSKNIVGAPGIQSFIFKTIKKGETSIEFNYKRQWETDKPPAKKIVYNVRVN